MKIDRRALARTAARIGIRVAGVALAAGVGVAAVAASSAPLPTFEVTPPSAVVEPEQSGQERVCPGPLLTIGADSADADAISSFGSADVAIAADPESAAVGEEPLVAADNPAADADGGPVLLAAEPGAVAPGMFGAAQSQEAATDSLGGFAAAACTEGLRESWLVGGATDVGRTTLILLANASQVAATVDVRVFGEGGAVAAPSALGIVVPPRTQRVLSLAGLAPNLRSPVVQVTNTGGRIAAAVQASAVDGLDPVGVDLVSPAAPPATTQIVPAVVISGAGGVDPFDDEAQGDAFPVMRLFAPGDDDVDAVVEFRSESGETVSTIDATVPAASAVDVPLGDLDPGAYTAAIDADAPVVAAVRSTLASDDAEAPGPVDFAWTPATAPLLDDAIVPVAAGPAATLQLSNPSGSDVEATVGSSEGERSVVVPAGGAASVALDDATPVMLSGVAGLHAAVTYQGARELASVVLQPPGPEDTPIRVYPR